mgnify:CR=1 FL=1
MNTAVLKFADKQALANEVARLTNHDEWFFQSATSIREEGTIVYTAKLVKREE